MEKEITLNQERYMELQRKVYDIAKAHGWHDRTLSPQHYCGLIMTEVAEIVEADRKGRRAQTAEFKRALTFEAANKDSYFNDCYKDYIKGSIEEEFADVVIRLLDMAQGLHGDEMCWFCGRKTVFRDTNGEMSVVENAWYFIKGVLNWGMLDICDSVTFMCVWAQHLGIDLWQHIEWKMKYNEYRPYKHGGKRY